MIAEWGGVATRMAPLADDTAAIRGRILEAAQTHDLVIVNAGSSPAPRISRRALSPSWASSSSTASPSAQAIP